MNAWNDQYGLASFRRGQLILAILSLAILIGVFHGRALDYGLFMDDYAHYRQLREADWSLGDLVDACRLDLSGGVIDLWWMPECTLRFFRPIAFGIMKLTYTLGGWRPAAAHVASLFWHLAACILLMLLLRRLGISRRIAWIVACLFATHPGHVATVQWIASQTELIVTTLLLGAMLCWAEFRGWPSGVIERTKPRVVEHRRAWGVACLLLFAAALGCRENAVVFPFVILAVEPLMRGEQRRRVVSIYACFGVVIGAYWALRTHYLGGLATPPRPYIVPPGAEDFFPYIIDKACYYLLGEFLLAPCVPIGGLAYFHERPTVFYGLTLFIVVVLVFLFIKNRLSARGVLGPACLFGFMAPVLPAFESPHHLYLPGVGWAIVAALFIQEVGGYVPGRTPSEPLRMKLAGFGSLATVLVFGVATHFFSMALDTAQAVEDHVVEEIAEAPRPVADGDTLYIANLPMIAHYVRLAVEERTGARDLKVIPLTWAPRLLGVATPTELVRIDERTIEMCVRGDRYFSGPVRLLVEQSNGGVSPIKLNQPVVRTDFTATPVAGDADGITALRFTFNRSIAQAGVHLFWGSKTRWAYQISHIKP